MTARIGFIGLGIMGRPMAHNLIKAGYALSVHARRPDMMQPLVAAGATACENAQAVAAQSDIVITMVSDTPDVEHVILGEHGVIHGAQAGNIIIDMSTIVIIKFVFIKYAIMDKKNFHSIVFISKLLLINSVLIYFRLWVIF